MYQLPSALRDPGAPLRSVLSLDIAFGNNEYESEEATCHAYGE